MSVLSDKQIIAERYEILNYHDEGGMQFVYVAKDNVTDQIVALKTPKNQSAEKRFLRSARLAAKINHPNAAKTLDYIEADGRSYLIEEFIDGGDLQKIIIDRVAFVDPYMIAKIFRHLAKGVSAAQHVNVVHRDLKPSNIMICGGFNVTALKVTDFGVAKMAADEIDAAVEGGETSIAASATAVGALPYMAPEGISEPLSVGLPADIWSVGSIILHLLYGDFPFGSGLKAVPNILAAKSISAPPIIYSKSQFLPLVKELESIALSCVTLDPKSRPGADELVKMCNDLCYTMSDRYEGSVKNLLYQSFGFINADEEEVFYHVNSVFGTSVSPGDRVVFSSYPSGQQPRALPVVKLL